MGSSFRLGRLFGIPIEVNVSWIFVFALLTFLLANEFEDPHLRWSEAQRWSVALIAVLLFFLSVLAHELSHSLVAVAKGIPVQCITLFIFGGISRLTREPNCPFTEFIVAVTGPLSSISLSGVFGGIWFLLGQGESSLEVVLLLGAWSNLSLGIFNLVPGYPLDGGRVLRAGVWGLTGSYHRGTQVAACSGQLVGGSILLAGIALAILLGPVEGVWITLIGGFIFIVARSSYPGDSGDRSVNHAWLC